MPFRRPSSSGASCRNSGIYRAALKRKVRAYCSLDLDQPHRAAKMSATESDAFYVSHPNRDPQLGVDSEPTRGGETPGLPRTGTGGNTTP